MTPKTEMEFLPQKTQRRKENLLETRQRFASLRENFIAGFVNDCLLTEKQLCFFLG
jgi:hypothetical protein